MRETKTKGVSMLLCPLFPKEREKKKKGLQEKNYFDVEETTLAKRDRWKRQNKHDRQGAVVATDMREAIITKRQKS